MVTPPVRWRIPHGIDPNDKMELKDIRDSVDDTMECMDILEAKLEETKTPDLCVRGIWITADSMEYLCS